MRVVESQWWIMDLPSEWNAEQDEETIVISDEDGVGEIVITTMEKQNGCVEDLELREYTSDLDKSYGDAKQTELGILKGYFYSYQEESDAVREWYLRSGSLLVLITYSCDISNAGMDDSAVDEILSTFFIKQENNNN